MLTKKYSVVSSTQQQILSTCFLFFDLFRLISPISSVGYKGLIYRVKMGRKTETSFRPRFQTKTEPFCSEYGHRPHYNVENDPRKRSHSKTVSRVERFENDAFWKRCFLVWTELKTMLSENGEVIKIHTTGRQTTLSWVSKMADRRYHVAWSEWLPLFDALASAFNPAEAPLRFHKKETRYF